MITVITKLDEDAIANEVDSRILTFLKRAGYKPDSGGYISIELDDLSNIITDETASVIDEINDKVLS